MPFNKSLLRVSILGLTIAPVLGLAACEGYEVKPYYGVPYTHSRTAGHGVEWVRSNMMAPKTTNTQTITKVEETVQTPVQVIPPPPATGDRVFQQHQSK